MGAGCGTKINEYVTRGWTTKEITVKCGETSPSGEPWQCDKCAKKNAGRDWRKEAIENGERWDEDD